MKKPYLYGAALLAGAVLSGCVNVPPVAPVTPVGKPVATEPTVPGQPSPLKVTTFDSLPGWHKDDLRQAWPTFLASCQVIGRKAEWKESCATARGINPADAVAIRAFFEKNFQPYQVVATDGKTNGLITGYYEPLLRGARRRGGQFQTPLHRVPADLFPIDMGGLYPELKTMRLRGRIAGGKVVPYYSRAELADSGSLVGNELVWVDDPVEAFFLQVQGSGRVQLQDSKETVRLAYADQNGHPYKSIGRYLVDKGELKLEQASAQSIKSWIIANPSRTAEVLNANPSYVFFREEKIADPAVGPKGSLGVPLTPERSLAVDPQTVPLGVPVFLSTSDPVDQAPIQRLMMAQDTGGAIKGAVRADYFWGFGHAAGEKAGKTKQSGEMWLLLPKPVVPAT